MEAPHDRPMFAAKGLKCAPCTDQHILDDRGTSPDTVPDAFTITTVMQTFAAGGQQIAAPVQLPVCYPCRKRLLGTVSKAGLAVA